MNNQNIIEAAKALQSAERGLRLETLPDHLVPDSVETAYAIQDALLAGQTVGGWKIAPAAAGEVPRCSAFADTRIVQNGTALPFELQAPEVEVEVAFRLGKDLPGRATAYSRDDIINAIGSTHVAFEILDSRFVDRKKVSSLAALADSQSNCLVVLGDGVEGYPGETSLRPALTIRGTHYAVEKALPENGAVLDAVAWLAQHAASRGHPLTAGQIVITGARVGPIPIPRSTLIEAEIPLIGGVRTQFLAIEIA